MRRRSLLLLLFAFLPNALPAQRASPNPFDIEARLPRRNSSSEAVTAPDVLAANPFNVVPHRRPERTKEADKPMEKPAVKQITDRSVLGPPLAEHQIFWLLIGLMAFLAFSVASRRDVLAKAWRAFLNDNALSVALRDADSFIGSRPYYLLYASFFLNAGVFIFLITRHFAPERFNHIGFLLLCLVATPLLFIGKHALLYGIGSIFPLKEEMRRYGFLVMLFNCVLGLFLLPFNFLLAYQRPYSGFLVFWLLALAAIFYIYRYLRAATIARKFLPRHLFHFLLYLCSVELAPVLVLVRWVTSLL